MSWFIWKMQTQMQTQTRTAIQFVYDERNVLNIFVRPLKYTQSILVSNTERKHNFTLIHLCDRSLQ